MLEIKNKKKIFVPIVLVLIVTIFIFAARINATQEEETITTDTGDVELTICEKLIGEAMNVRIQDDAYIYPLGSKLLFYHNQNEETGELSNLFFEFDSIEDCYERQSIVVEFWNEREIKTRIAITDKQEEDLFFQQHPEYFMADKLNSEIHSEGTISSELSGSIPVTNVRGNLFYTTSYTTQERVNFKLQGDISMIGKVNVPTKQVSEEEFYELNEKYDKLVRCVEVESQDYWLDGQRPYLVFCAFDVDGLQFLTVIESITEEKEGCYSHLEKDVYVTEEGSDYLTFKYELMFNIDESCTKHPRYYTEEILEIYRHLGWY